MNIERIRGRVRATWGTLTDDDVERAKGNLEELAGIIKQKTSENIDTIRQKLQAIGDEKELAR
jgi:uncharacterized protein YjbJ (UPF0337 family)